MFGCQGMTLLYKMLPEFLYFLPSNRCPGLDGLNLFVIFGHGTLPVRIFTNDATVFGLGRHRDNFGATGALIHL